MHLSGPAFDTRGMQCAKWPKPGSNSQPAFFSSGWVSPDQTTLKESREGVNFYMKARLLLVLGGWAPNRNRKEGQPGRAESRPKQGVATAEVAHSSVPCSVLGALNTVFCPHLTSSSNALLAKVPVGLLHGLHRDQSEGEDGIRMDTRSSGGHTYSVVINWSHSAI